MTGPISVLVVDDDELDRYAVGRQLGKHPEIGRVVEVADGSEAYDLVAGERFESELGPHPPRTLILLDINMPLMSGFDFLEAVEREALLSSADACVVVMLTSSSYFGDRERAEQFEVVGDYVEKPLRAPQIRSLIERFWPEHAAPAND
ncbi:MAG: response regulator [Acidimicrobiales bacterium]